MKYIYTIFLLSCVLVSASSQCNSINCSVCDIEVRIVSSNADIINGVSEISQTIQQQNKAIGEALELSATGCGVITFTVEIDFIWDKGFRNNWIHGVSFEASDGWSSGAGIVPPRWLFRDEITGDCSGKYYGDGGFYYDGTTSQSNCDGNNNGVNDQDPSNNWGVDCTEDCPKFGFELEFCPIISGDVTETISFIFTDDGETGDWNEPADCIFEIEIPVKILSAGIYIPVVTHEICAGEKVLLEAGNGCDDYLWNTGETDRNIYVSPSETTTYSVTVGSGSCIVSEEIEVIVNDCCGAEAGYILLSDDEVCLHDELTITLQNNKSESGFLTYLYIVDESGIIIEKIESSTATISFDRYGDFLVFSYNIAEDLIHSAPKLGDEIYSVICTTNGICCDLSDEDPLGNVATFSVALTEECQDVVNDVGPQISVPNIISLFDNNNRATIFSGEAEYTVLVYEIYDRWGNLMFSHKNFPTNDPTYGWNGTFRSEPVAQGVYVYRTIVLHLDGKEMPYYGSITVMR